MALVDFSLLTIPVPVPYDKNLPTQNQENAAFLFMQIIDLFKQAGAQLELPFSVNVQNPAINLTFESGSVLEDIHQAIIDLQFNGYAIKVGNMELILHRQYVGEISES